MTSGKTTRSETATVEEARAVSAALGTTVETTATLDEGEAPVGNVHHEATAVFERVATDLEDLLAQVRAYARTRGVHGRRLARVATIVEDAVLHARQGAHEARYGQEDGWS